MKTTAVSTATHCNNAIINLGGNWSNGIQAESGVVLLSSLPGSMIMHLVVMGSSQQF